MTRILATLYLLLVPFAVVAFVYGADAGFVMTVAAFAIACGLWGAVGMWVWMGSDRRKQ